MKILLLNPPFYRFIGLEQDYVPLSLLAVGTHLKKNSGHEVYVKNLEIDNKLTYSGYENRSKNFDRYLEHVEDLNHPIWLELKQVIEEIKPDKIGITVLNVKFKSAQTIIKIANSYNIPVMVGGPHPTISPEKYDSNIEIYSGEFESSERIKNLDLLQFPDYSILLDKYSPNGYGHIMSSRGCPFKCSFCASHNMWHRRVTFKSIDRIISEMKYIEDNFHPEYFTFWDETFTINKKRIIEFCNKYDLKTKWRCDTRADSLDYETAKLIKEHGCESVSVGIESGVDRILKSVNKGETKQDFINIAKILNSLNFHWKAYCIIGFPNETEEDIRESINFIKSLKPTRITLSFFTPYEGTQLFDECLKDGLITKHYNETLYAHQSPHNCFSKYIDKEHYFKLRNEISNNIDQYNKEAIKYWK